MQFLTRHRVRSGDDEAGMVLILVSLLMVAILLVAALVVDYGFVRNSRQDSRRTADLAATAGANALATTGVALPWTGACEAFAYLKANQSSRTFTATYSDGGGSAVAGNPCSTLLNQQCVANTTSTWAWIRATDGQLVVDIKTGYKTPDASFAEDSSNYSGDNGDSLQGGCDQIAVIVSKTDGAQFGKVAGSSSYSTRIRSVGRVVIGGTNKGVPAFLMLERKKCAVLTQQVGTGGGSGIIVDAATTTDPGIIHVDSKGAATTGCSGTNNSNGWAIYSTAIGSSPGIQANATTTGVAGIIEVYGLKLGGTPNYYASCCSPSGVSPTPTAGLVVSRKPVDDKYNPSTAPTITSLHSVGAIDANRTSAPANSLGALGVNDSSSTAWTTYSCSDKSGSFAGTKVFVNCTNGYSPTAATFPNATDIIFRGPVSIGNNSSLYLPLAQRVVVAGTSSGGLSVSNGGQLGVNSGTWTSDAANSSFTGTSGACATRDVASPPRITKLVVFGGASNSPALDISGQAALCQTSVYLAGSSSNSTYSARQSTDGSYDPTCSTLKPCASDASTTPVNPITYANLRISGNAAYVRWSAPNQSTSQPAAGSVGVEDLALWTESYTPSTVSGNGKLEAYGVFFLPNTDVQMSAPSSATPRDAQFISRTLSLLQGTLRMKPTPGNSVQVPILASVSLVR